jgi:hypothetical protein
MNRNKLFVLIATAIFMVMPWTSHATGPAVKTRTPQGDSFVMCNAETDTALPCAGANGDIYALVDTYDTLTFFFSETSGTPATCDAFALGDVNVPGTTDLETLSADSLFTTPLSITRRIITLTNVDFKYVWVVCTSAAMSVTVEMRAADYVDQY